MDGHSYTDQLLRDQSINSELQRFIVTRYKKDESRIILSPNPNTLRCVLEILDEKSISVLMIVGAKFLDLMRRSTKQ